MHSITTTLAGSYQPAHHQQESVVHTTILQTIPMPVRAYLANHWVKATGFMDHKQTGMSVEEMAEQTVQRCIKDAPETYQIKGESARERWVELYEKRPSRLGLAFKEVFRLIEGQYNNLQIRSGFEIGRAVGAAVGAWFHHGGRITQYNEDQSRRLGKLAMQCTDPRWLKLAMKHEDLWGYIKLAGAEDIARRIISNNKPDMSSLRWLRLMDRPLFMTSWNGDGGTMLARVDPRISGDEDHYIHGSRMEDTEEFRWFMFRLMPDDTIRISPTARSTTRSVDAVHESIGLRFGDIRRSDETVQQLTDAFLKHTVSYSAARAMPLLRKVVRYTTSKKRKRRGASGRYSCRRDRVINVDFDAIATVVRRPLGGSPARNRNGEPSKYNGPAYAVGKYDREMWVREDNTKKGERWLDIKPAKSGGYLVLVKRTCNQKGYRVGDYDTAVERVKDADSLL